MERLQFFTPYSLQTYLLESLSDISEVYNWNTLLVSLRLSDWSGSSIFVWSSYKALHSDSIYLAVNSACCKPDIFCTTATQTRVWRPQQNQWQMSPSIFGIKGQVNPRSSMDTVKEQKSLVPSGNRVFRCPVLSSANVPTYTNKNHKFR